MGLGKTLTMIALIATDMDVEKELDSRLEDIETDKEDTTATLVIIPPPSMFSSCKSVTNLLTY